MVFYYFDFIFRTFESNLFGDFYGLNILRGSPYNYCILIIKQ